MGCGGNIGKTLLMGPAGSKVYDKVFPPKTDPSGAEQGIQGAGQTAYDRSKMTDAESAQYSSSFDMGKLLQQIMQYQAGTGAAPSGYQGYEQQYQNQGPMAQSLYNQTMSGMQNPDALYQSTLDPQLKLALGQVNAQAQGRGLLQSGLDIEQMGRAGTELAIQEAAARMQNRQQQYSNATTLENNITSGGQTNLANLYNLYGQQQSAGQNAMGRQATAAGQAAGYQAYPYQAQLGSYYGQQAAQQALPGQLIGAAGQLGAAYMTGGASLAASPSLYGSNTSYGTQNMGSYSQLPYNFYGGTANAGMQGR